MLVYIYLLKNARKENSIKNAIFVSSATLRWGNLSYRPLNTG